MTDSAAPTRRTGFWSPPVAGAIDSRAILGDIEALEHMPLADFSRRIGWTPTGQSYALRNGWFTAEPAERGHAYVISSDEAYKLLFAALLAAAAGVAIAVMLRGLSGAGVTGETAAAAIRNMPA